MKEVRGVALHRARDPGDEGEKQEVAGRRGPSRPRGRARRRVPLSSWREEGDDWRRPAGWAGLLGRWARPHSARPRVSPGRVFLFYFFSIFLTFVWFKKILNHFIFLCQFLWKLVILFQSSFINGIIFGHIYYI